MKNHHFWFVKYPVALGFTKLTTRFLHGKLFFNIAAGAVVRLAP
jgi:hypothetical protein